MSHLKRQSTPKSWPISRKGKTFVVGSRFEKESSVPILIVLKEMVKVGKTRAEIKKIITNKEVFLNNKLVHDDKIGVCLFDALSFPRIKKFYKLFVKQNGKFELKEIKESEANSKIFKVLNKKILKNKKIQLNLSNGRNLLSDEKCAIKDSVILDLEKNKILKILPLKENSKVFLFKGKHIGEEGKIKELKANKSVARVDFGNKEVEVLTKQLIVVE